MKLRSNATARTRAGRYVLAAAALAASGGAHALKFQLTDGIEGSFDTTLGYGLAMRTERPDKNLSRSWPYTDNYLNNNQYGNRTLFENKWDVFSNVVKASHDLQLNGDGWSAFMRGNYFYDFAMLGQDRNLPQAAENRAIKHGDITDAYFLTRLGGNDQFTVRLGKQVISWGENTFIGGSLNDINTFDISKIRQPGVELKDALVGTPAAYFSWQMTDALSLETFVLLGFDEVKADPYGSFYATLDPITDGAGFANALVGGGTVKTCIAPDGGTCALNGLPRSGDDIPSYGGQYGVALRYYAPSLGNGFDFGLYYQKLHDHNPQISAYAGPNDGNLATRVGTFFLDYAENVERYGVSFNTTLGPWAVGGEYSYRRNAPIQGTDFLFVGLFGADARGNPFAANTKFEGFERYKRHQIQLTTQRLWGPMPMLLGADQWNTIGEVAFGWVDDMPGRDVNGHRRYLEYVAPSLSPIAMVTAAAAASPDGFVRFDDVDGHFWGFQARSTLTYNNILFNRINMDFNTAFRWDVEGTSPELGGAQLFVSGRKQASVGVTFDYALRWKVGINQTFVFDGDNDQWRPTRGRNVSNTDRDFLSLDVSYTF